MEKIKKGNCFEKSFRIVTDLKKCKDVRLVHGVISRIPNVKGNKILHGWVEVGDVVLDIANNRKTIMAKDSYYEKYKVKKIYKYTSEEAYKKGAEAGFNYGPWEKRLLNLKDVQY